MIEIGADGQERSDTSWVETMRATIKHYVRILQFHYFPNLKKILHLESFQFEAVWLKLCILVYNQ